VPGKPRVRTFYLQVRKPLNILFNHLKRIEKVINRLVVQLQSVKYRNRQKMNNDRKSRTRTLIQLGGLVEKAWLSKLFDISLGSDLQLETNESAKAATLLGLLLESKENAIVQLHDNQQLGHWKNKGLKKLI